MKVADLRERLLREGVESSFAAWTVVLRAMRVRFKPSQLTAAAKRSGMRPGELVAENAIANVLTLGVLRPFHTALGLLAHLDAGTRGLWKVVSGGKVVLAAGATLTVEPLVGAGAAYVAKSIVEGKPPADAATATSWAIQGASMAVGKFVHGRMRDLNELWAKFGEEKIAVGHVRQQERLAAKAGIDVKAVPKIECAMLSRKDTSPDDPVVIS